MLQRLTEFMRLGKGMQLLIQLATKE